MQKLLARLLVIGLLAPFASLTAFGLWHGLAVRNDLVTLASSFLGWDLVISDVPQIPVSTLPVNRLDVRWMGPLDSEALPETSGLAASRLADNVFFAINDSGNLPILYALTREGVAAGQWPVEYSDTHDFEDLASFTLDSKHYLLIADTGDNLLWRKQQSIIVIEEPALESSGTLLTPAWQFQFSFVDGARDIEGVAVDETGGRIYLVTKRHIPPELFELPLQPGMVEVKAQFVTRLIGIPAPTVRDLREDQIYGRYSSCPTAFDISGRNAVVLTYKEAYLYHRGVAEQWPAVFAGLPVRIPLPYIHGLESVAFDTQGSRLLLTGERRGGRGPADIFQVDL